MAARAKAAHSHLRPVEVDPQTGEVVSCTHALNCEECMDARLASDELVRKYHGALSEIGRLRGRRDEEARGHKLWPQAMTVHEWWRLACWHPQVRFDPDDFYNVKPRLEEREIGVVGMLKAVAGIAFDPMVNKARNGKTIRYDSFELLTRSAEKTYGFMERVPGGPDRERWKFWLVRRIESCFLSAEQNTGR